MFTKKSQAPSAPIPFGSMVPPKMLQTAFSGIALLNRKTFKVQLAKFRNAFKLKFPVSTMADFARQFDRTVPDTADGPNGYFRHAVYNACVAAFRYDGKPKASTAKGKTAKGKGNKPSKRNPTKTQAANQAKSKAFRLLMRIVFQLGLPRELFNIAGTRCGFSPVELDTMWTDKGNLADVGLRDYVVAFRSGDFAGKPVLKALSESKARKSGSPVTTAELASMSRGNPLKNIKRAPAGKSAPIVESANMPSKAFKARQPKPTVLKASDNLSTK